MPQVELSEETLERLDAIEDSDLSYDEKITELINIVEAEEMTMHHAGEEY